MIKSAKKSRMSNPDGSGEIDIAYRILWQAEIGSEDWDRA
jgi:hypothetical protein